MQSMLWQVYRFREHTVSVIEQWKNPYGQEMVRIQSMEDHDDRAEGMDQETFLAHAVELIQGADDARRYETNTS